MIPGMNVQFEYMLGPIDTHQMKIKQKKTELKQETVARRKKGEKREQNKLHD
jgi:hypothetical protein